MRLDVGGITQRVPVEEAAPPEDALQLGAPQQAQDRRDGRADLQRRPVQPRPDLRSGVSVRLRVRLEPYTTLNATVSLRFLQGTRLTVIGRNLTDEIYIPRSNSDVSGRLGAPRSFEIQLTRVF